MKKVRTTHQPTPVPIGEPKRFPLAVKDCPLYIPQRFGFNRKSLDRNAGRVTQGRKTKLPRRLAWLPIPVEVGYYVVHPTNETEKRVTVLL